MGRRSDMMLGTKAIVEGWDMEPAMKNRVIQMMLDIVEGHVKSSTREKIRAAECLAKIDALNVTREGQDKARGLNVQILPPAYEQMSEQANTEMITYLQAAALPTEGEAESDPSEVIDEAESLA